MIDKATSPDLKAGFELHLRETQGQIERLEQQWRAAQLAGDVTEADRMLADDYVGINVTGQVNTKAQFLSRMRNHTLQLTRIDTKERKIRLYRDVAVVTVRASVQGTSEGLPVNGNFRYTRIYHRLASGAWQITNFEATRIPARHGAVVPVAVRSRPDSGGA